MKLTCPNCTAQYTLPDGSIGAEGREVRCAKCRFEWYQEPDDNIDVVEDHIADDVGDDSNVDDVLAALAEARGEILDEEVEDIDPQDTSKVDEVDEGADEDADDEASIPKSVTPEHDTTPNAAIITKRPPTLVARLSGFAVALVLFAVMIAGAFIYKKEIVTSWPPAAYVYDLAGAPVMYRGENLVMESLSASVMKNEQGNDVLVLKGRVINLTSAPIDVPQMMAVMRSTNGEDSEGWIIEAPVDSVEPGASFAFTSTYPDVPRGVGSVNLRFIPQVSG